MLACEIESPRLQAIMEQAARSPEGLDGELPAIPGFADAGLRNLVHYACQATTPLRYLEVGTFFGATLSMAMWQKEGIFVAVDDFSGFGVSKFVGPDGVEVEVDARSKRRHIQESMVKYGQGRSLFYEQSFLDVSPELVLSKTGGVTVFFYDGDHSAVSTVDGILHFSPAWAGEVLMLVDDYESEDVKSGVRCGLRYVPFVAVEQLVYVGGTSTLMCLLRRRKFAGDESSGTY